MSHPDPCYDYENSHDSDDGYDAYNEGYGPPVTRRQRQEEQEWADECRRNGW